MLHKTESQAVSLTFFRFAEHYYPPAPPGDKGKVPLALLPQLSPLSAYGLQNPCR